MNKFWILPAALALTSTSCISALEKVGPVSNPGEFIAEKRPAEVRAVTTDGSTYVLERPSVVGTTLRGLEFTTRQEVSLDFARVQRVEAVRLDPMRLRLAIVGGALLAGGITYAWLNSGDEDAPWCVLNVPYGQECGPAPQAASAFQLRIPVPW